MYFQRTIAAQLRQAAATRPSLIVTGARQVGKTTLLKASFPEASYITFDNILNMASAQESPGAFLDRFEGPVILDEIQYVPSLFPALKQRIDEDRDRNGRWLLTGSQRFELMRNVSESLAGRIAISHLETLSSQELRSGGLGFEDLAGLIVKGGYPELWSKPLIESESWFEDYIKTYIERDLKEIVQARSLVDFRRFLSLAAARNGELLNYSDLGPASGVSNNTAKAWMAALELSGIVYILPPYFSNSGKRLVKQPKLYFADTGLACALVNIHSPGDLERSGFAGHLWENLVFTELVKSGRRRPGVDLFFFRDHSGVELDFLLADAAGLTLIDAKYSERIRPERLPFGKVEARLGLPVVRRRVAAPTGSPLALPMDGYDIYDPRLEAAGA